MANNKTILVVDDDSALRTPLARGLRNAGFDVLTAESADVAGEILTRVTVDAMVLDRMMVGTDGLTFLKNLRAAGNATPTIILTAMGGAENTIDGLMGGADDYLAKPFQLQELVLRLNNIMHREPAPAPKMPKNLFMTDDEFFIKTANGNTMMLALSGEEKKLLNNLTYPVGNVVAAPPMVAKRLRNKLNDVLSNIDIVTVRGHGYKMVCTD
ncbi:MAG: response regulator transcription factor [Alphaproteobacteria bacterium]|nr:response regulator transcription factor [Alphaproteobacteria bacterium]MBR4806255.1 response regulator transcription factor [Alphaproteobacteria bacterium]